MSKFMRHALVSLAGILIICALPAAAQTSTPPPLNFGNNYFVTGDYVVAGVGLRGLGQLDPASGQYLATGTITMPDGTSVPSTGVPAGAQVVAAFLYWESVESTTTGSPTGQNGFFRPLYTGGPARYPISGVTLGNPNAPVSWSNGGCSGNAQGSKTIRAYRADVLPYLRQDSHGNILANQTYEVSLPDSGSNGGGTPLTLGATLVVIYRVISPDFPLKSIVIEDGAYAPANGSTNMIQPLQGFYQADKNPVSKLTQIVGNGQPNKFETVSLDNVALASVYGANAPAFIGYYNGSWDNPTWLLSGSSNPVMENDPSASTSTVPSGSNSGCVSWGAVIFSTTVKDTDKDGLLDKWEDNGGYTDALDGTFVPLVGACSGGPNQPATCAARNGNTQDVFLQMDYLCDGTVANPSATGAAACDPSTSTTGHSHYLDPNGQVMSDLTNVFSNRGITLHLTGGYAVQEAVCSTATESSHLLCPYPNQKGVLGWKVAVELLKSQPININPNTGSTWTESDCEAAAPGTCIRRFEHGKKDSYHYVLLGHSLGAAQWSLSGGSLLSASVDASGLATFAVTTDPKLTVNSTAGNGRITIGNVISAPALNNTYLVTNTWSVVNGTSTVYYFQVQTPVTGPMNLTLATDPNLAIGSGQAGSGSGVSDRGGADSLITLGSWGSAGTAVPVLEGTIMHELGHTFGLTHSGYSYIPTAKADNNYTPIIEANCKPDYLSVMNYLYQIDLLDGKYLDYSGQTLSGFNETTGFAGPLVDLGTLAPATYATTDWFTNDTSTLVGNPTPAKRHCDGTPITDGAKMYRVVSSTSSLTLPGIDLNFDGTPSETFTGYNDWANLDLRQIGATGSELIGAGIGGNWGGIGGTWGGIGANWGGIGGNWGGIGGNWGGIGGNWGGIGGNWGGIGGTWGGIGANWGGEENELDFTMATSSVRPPTALNGTPHDTRTSHSVTLTWTAPTGILAPIQYNIYRKSTQDTGYPTTPTYISGGPSFTDSTVSDCTTYIYLVTAVFTDTTDPTKVNESTPTNSFSYSVPCTPTNFSGTRSTAGITLSWSAAPRPSGSPASYTVIGYNLYRDNGTTPIATPTTTTSPYFDPITDGLVHTYYLTAVVSDQQGCTAGQYCRESTQVSTIVKGASTTTITGTSTNPSILGQPITVSFSVTPSNAGGSVTVSDGNGATCSGNLGSSGAGSCLLTPTEFVNNKPAVGPITLTATYAGDANYYGSTSAPYTQNVIYKFIGFLSPLNLTAYSGTFNLGKAVPLKWQLTDWSGAYVSQLSTLQTLTAIFNSGPAATCAASTSGTPFVLYSPSSGVTGNSTFRYDTTNNQFVFNWDTTSVSSTGAGCYTLVMVLNDGSAAKMASLQLVSKK
jgi:hypothetical protein